MDTTPQATNLIEVFIVTSSNINSGIAGTFYTGN